jgi:hypothetical protein
MTQIKNPFQTIFVARANFVCAVLLLSAPNTDIFDKICIIFLVKYRKLKMVISHISFDPFMNQNKNLFHKKV